MPAAAVPGEEVQVRPRHHHRRGVRLQDHQREGQADQAADLGHGRPGDLQVDHALVLPRLDRRGAGVRHHEPRLV